MDLIFNLAIVTLMGLIAIIAGIFEDLESDVASTSNPNSQVQLAPQIGNLHKYVIKNFNKSDVAFSPYLFSLLKSKFRAYFTKNSKVSKSWAKRTAIKAVLPSSSTTILKSASAFIKDIKILAIRL